MLRRQRASVLVVLALLASVVVTTSALRARDVQAEQPGMTELQSAVPPPDPIAPLDGESSEASISGDGRYVVFTHRPKLDGQVVLRDRADESLRYAGPNGFVVPSSNDRFAVSQLPAISRNGCQAVMHARTTATWGVFALDRCGGGEAVDLSARWDGRCEPAYDVKVDSRPAISANGRFVAYTRRVDRTCPPPVPIAPPVPGALNAQAVVIPGELVVVLVDRDADADGVFDETASGAVGVTLTPVPYTSGPSAQFDPVLSDDGRQVVFTAAIAVDLGLQVVGREVIVAWQPQRGTGIGAFAFLSRAEGATPLDVTKIADAAGSPAVSGDGRFVAFESSGSLLPTTPLPSNPDCNGVCLHLWLRDRDPDGDGVFDEVLDTSAPQLVTRLADGTYADGDSTAPSLSQDGTFLAFATQADNLEPGGTTGGVFVFDRIARTFARLTVSPTGTEVPAPTGQPPTGQPSGSDRPWISSTGRFVAYEAPHLDELIPTVNPSSVALQVFVRERPLSVRLTPDPTNFGEVAANAESLPRTLTLTNDGPVQFRPDLETASLPFRIVSDTCHVGAPPAAVPKLLRRNESCQLVVVVDAGAPGSASGTATVTESPSFRPISASATLRATIVQPVLLIDPTFRDFGTVRLGEASAPFRFTVRANASIPVTVASVAIAPTAGFEVVATTCVGTAVTASAPCTVDVRFAPVSRGAVGATLGVGAAGGATVTASLRGRGIAAAALTIEPTNFTFDARPVGTTSPSATFVVSNVGDEAATLDAVGGLDAPFTLVVPESSCAIGVELVAGATCTVAVRFTPATRGLVTTTLTASEPGSSASATIAGIGQQALLTINPPSVDFGELVVGSTSAPQTFTVRNSGDLPVLVTAAGALGGAATDYLLAVGGCVGLTLDPSSTCTVTVAFRPATAGPRVSTLTVAGTENTSAAANLLGRAIFQPTLVMSPAVGRAGSRTTPVGTNFPPNATITVSWPTVGTFTVQTDALGRFVDAPQILVLEVMRNGSHTVTALGQPESFADVPATFLVALPTVRPPGFAIQPISNQNRALVVRG